MKQNKLFLLEVVVPLLMLLIVGCSVSPDSSWVADIDLPKVHAIGKIAFVHRDERTLSESIYVVNADGSELRQLSSDMKNATDPDWSPDGEYLGFSMLTNGVNQIYRVRSDGSDLRQLTFGKFSSSNPLWSQDGKYILFLSLIGDSSADNEPPLQQGFIMSSDGLGQRPLTSEHDFVTSLSWYKDDNLISVSTADTRYKVRVRLIDLNGLAQDLTIDFIIDGIPNWSPDGKTLIFSPFVVRSNCTGFIIFKISNLNQECVVIDSFSPTVISKNPAWSPDGQYIIFSSNRDGDYDLYISKMMALNLNK